MHVPADLCCCVQVLVELILLEPEIQTVLFALQVVQGARCCDAL